MGEFFWMIFFGACIWVPLIWNKIAIGKRIAYEEKKAGRDLTGEIVYWRKNVNRRKKEAVTNVFSLNEDPNDESRFLMQNQRRSVFLLVW